MFRVGALERPENLRGGRDFLPRGQVERRIVSVG